MSYYAFDIKVDPIVPYRDMVLFYLNEIGFESHEETETGLISYILAEDFKEKLFQNAIQIDGATINFVKNLVEQQNWNELWEKNFDPVYINDQCVICASFHDLPDLPYKLLINPKMAFGTGHHETTSMICEQLFDEDLQNKTVLDMGCGTAVLAILAEKLGASELLAIDTDEWAVNNSIENLGLNNTNNISVLQGDSSVLGDKVYNIILANINKNVLLSEMKNYVTALETGGIIVFSGFYRADSDDIIKAGNNFGLSFVSKREKNNWNMVKMIKSS